MSVFSFTIVAGPHTQGTLNRNLLNSGLDDSKIGDLHYFDGIFYVLNDNERVIRAWDLESGTLLSTTKLPRVEGRFDHQWEGMAFQRYDPSEDTNKNVIHQLGREANTTTTSSSVLRKLHLALDTPAQVWTFVVGEQVDAASGNSIPGSIAFPPCAGTN